MDQDTGKPSRGAAKTPRRTVAKRTVTDERQAAAMAKIAKGFKRLSVDNRPKGPQFIAVLLCVLGLALVFYKIFQPPPRAIDGFAVDKASATTPATTATLVVPEDHRGAIENFESLLFGNAGEDLDLVVSNLSGSGGALVRDLEGPGAGPAEQAVARGLAAQLERLTDESLGLPLDRVASLRETWLAMRARYFEPADFLRVPSTGAGQDSMEIAVRRSLLTDLEQAVVGATDHAAVLAEEIRTNVDETVRTNARKDLAETRLELLRQLAEIRRATPAPPTGAQIPAALMLGVQANARALDLAAQLGSSDGELAQNRPLLEAFFDQIELAQRSFGEL